jgi:DNA-binding NtrC family response regulator
MSRDDLIFLGACILAAPGGVSLAGAVEKAEALMAFSRSRTSVSAPPVAPRNLREELLADRDRKIREAMEICEYNISKAARMVGMKRTTLTELMKRARAQAA